MDTTNYVEFLKGQIEERNLIIKKYENLLKESNDLLRKVLSEIK